MIVVGGGPAGCSCAITAARAGARVLLLEKDRPPRHKVCGEFVSSESLGLLASLLNRIRFNERPQIVAARVFLGTKTISLPITPPARSIPRFDLDAALLDAARESGVDVKEGTSVQQVERSTDPEFAVRAGHAGFRAKAVVNASGRWSQLTAHREVPGSKWIGVKAHFREAHPPQSVDLYFFTGGYCGVQPVSGNSVNAAAMVRSDVAQSMEQVLAAHPDLSRRSRHWEPLFAPITTSPLYFRTPETEDQGMLLAGDAAAFIDPFAGDGISLALHSGKLAAECLTALWRGTASRKETLRRYDSEYRSRFGHAFRNAARLRKLLTSPPWLRSGLLGLIEKPLIAEFIVRGTRAR